MFWDTRSRSLAHKDKLPSIREIEHLFQEIDRKIGLLKGDERYGMTLVMVLSVKARQLLFGVYSLFLDGLFPMGGCLLRPACEHIDTLEWLCSEENRRTILNGTIEVRAGEISKQVNGVYKELKDYLADTVTHVSFSREGLEPLFEKSTGNPVIQPRFSKSSLEKNLSMLGVFLSHLDSKLDKHLQI